MPLHYTSREGPLGRVLFLVGLGTIYFVAGRFGLLFSYVHASASPVWPPTGIAIAATLLFGPRVWPAIFFGAFLVNITTAGSVATSLGISVGNTLEALAAGYLVGRFANGARAFERARGVFTFAVLAGFVSTAVSATVGVLTLLLAGDASREAALRIWWTWWLGDLAGALVVAPALVLAVRTRPLGFGGRTREAGLVLAATLLVGFGVFGPLGTGRSLSFLCLPPLAWTAFRFRPRDVALSVVTLSGVAVWGTSNGVGTFAEGSLNESFLILEAFMATMATTMLPVSAVVAEARRVGREREQARAAAEGESARLDAVLRAKDEFLALLSHELRTPLAAITSAVYLLESPERRADRDGATAILARQVRHLARIVDDLLDLARVTSGSVVLQRRPTNLAETVADGVAGLRIAGQLDRHHLDLDTRPAWVDGDPERLQQVVTNLLANAIKYTPAGGHLRVRTDRRGSEAVLQVEDDGVGIPSDKLPLVFEPFFQGESAIDRGQGGLGLGLTLVHRLVGLHGGTVEAESHGRDLGATFAVRLPAVEAPRRIEAFEAAEAAPAAGRVLLVEDNEDARESLRLVLERQGYVVTCAGDGPAGVQAFRHARPDVVLVDVGLPGFDGYEVARRIRSEPAGGGMLLVALTGYGQPQDRREAEDAGFDLHVVKPVDPRRLFDLLAASARHRAERPGRASRAEQEG
jgi:signal transduction histidine kinase/CheY-like chemotaxis protein